MSSETEWKSDDEMPTLTISPFEWHNILDGQNVMVVFDPLHHARLKEALLRQLVGSWSRARVCGKERLPFVSFLTSDWRCGASIKTNPPILSGGGDGAEEMANLKEINWHPFSLEWLRYISLVRQQDAPVRPHLVVLDDVAADLLSSEEQRHLVYLTTHPSVTVVLLVPGDEVCPSGILSRFHYMFRMRGIRFIDFDDEFWSDHPEIDAVVHSFDDAHQPVNFHWWSQ